MCVTNKVLHRADQRPRASSVFGERERERGQGREKRGEREGKNRGRERKEKRERGKEGEREKVGAPCRNEKELGGEEVGR